MFAWKLKTLSAPILTNWISGGGESLPLSQIPTVSLNQLMCPVNDHCLRSGDTVGCLNKCIPEDECYSLKEPTSRIAE